MRKLHSLAGSPRCRCVTVPLSPPDGGLAQNSTMRLHSHKIVGGDCYEVVTFVRVPALCDQRAGFRKAVGGDGRNLQALRPGPSLQGYQNIAPELVVWSVLLQSGWYDVSIALPLLTSPVEPR